MNKLILLALIALTASATINLTEFNNGEIKRHNELRAKHQDTPALVFNETCRQHAQVNYYYFYLQAWAEKICEDNANASNTSLVWGHSTDRGSKMGGKIYFLYLILNLENLYAFFSFQDITIEGGKSFFID